jgi:hypothetical protein
MRRDQTHFATYDAKAVLVRRWRINRERRGQISVAAVLTAQDAHDAMDVHSDRVGGRPCT